MPRRAGPPVPTPGRQSGRRPCRDHDGDSPSRSVAGKGVGWPGYHPETSDIISARVGEASASDGQHGIPQRHTWKQTCLSDSSGPHLVDAMAPAAMPPPPLLEPANRNRVALEDRFLTPKPPVSTVILAGSSWRDVRGSKLAQQWLCSVGYHHAQFVSPHPSRAQSRLPIPLVFRRCGLKKTIILRDPDRTVDDIAVLAKEHIGFCIGITNTAVDYGPHVRLRAQKQWPVHESLHVSVNANVLSEVGE